MKQAGGPADVFDTAVKELIHGFTGGIARQINNLGALLPRTRNPARVVGSCRPR